MDIEKFISSLVSIDYVESENAYGHYPFALYAENAEGKAEINSLAGVDVSFCYKRFVEYVDKGYKRIYMSMDFAPILDIKTDFVFIMVYDKEIQVKGLPYDKATGKTFDLLDVKQSYALRTLFTQFYMITTKRFAKQNLN